MQYRRDHAFFNRHGQRDIDLGIVTNAFCHPACIHSRVFRQYTRDQRDQQIRQRRFDAMRSFHLHSQPLMRLEQTARIGITR